MINFSEEEAKDLVAQVKAMANGSYAPSPAEFEALCIRVSAFVADLQKQSRKPGDPWIVYVDDNFHFMDEEERYQLGEYASEAEAVAAARGIIDSFLQDGLAPGVTAEQLYERFQTFGEDPWIPGSAFHAWRYAREECKRLCEENSTS